MELPNAENEVLDLIIGEDKVVDWFKSELKKFEDKGWIAQ
jgi:hypothetical protein